MPNYKPDKGLCSLGKPAYPNKQAAVKASPKGKAERCGRCRQWHPA